MTYQGMPRTKIERNERTNNAKRKQEKTRQLQGKSDEDRKYEETVLDRHHFQTASLLQQGRQFIGPLLCSVAETDIGSFFTDIVSK